MGCSRGGNLADDGLQRHLDNRCAARRRASTTLGAWNQVPRAGVASHKGIAAEEIVAEEIVAGPNGAGPNGLGAVAVAAGIRRQVPAAGPVLTGTTATRTTRATPPRLCRS